MLHIFEFRVQKYADKGGYPLSLKFYIVYALVFYSLYVRKMDERHVINLTKKLRENSDEQVLIFEVYSLASF